MMEAFLPPAAATAAARTSTTKKTIDDWALRFPTSAEDVARVLKLLIDRILNGDFQSVDYAPSCPPRDVYHVSSPYGITKYELMRLQAMAMNIATSEVDERTAGDSSGPPKDSAPRPRCTQLDCGETWRALGSNGVELTYEFVSLERGMKRSLGGFPERFARM
jgi:dTDP-4-dehydrorhamnose reductase